MIGASQSCVCEQRMCFTHNFQVYHGYLLKSNATDSSFRDQTIAICVSSDDQPKAEKVLDDVGDD